MAKPQYIQKISQSPADTLLPCIIDQWQHSFPMDTTWNTMMKPDRVANICHNGIYNGMSNAILTRDSKWFSIRKKKKWINSNQTSNRTPASNPPPPPFFFLFLSYGLTLLYFHSACSVISLSLFHLICYMDVQTKKKKKGKEEGVPIRVMGWWYEPARLPFSCLVLLTVRQKGLRKLLGMKAKKSDQSDNLFRRLISCFWF